jgi:hypothetical protein
VHASGGEIGLVVLLSFMSLGSDIVPYPSKRSPLIFYSQNLIKYVSPLQRACKMGSGTMRVDPKKNTFAIDISSPLGHVRKGLELMLVSSLLL